MSKIKEVSIGGGLKLSINYQTVEAHVTITAEVEEGEDLEQVKQEIYEKLEPTIRETLSKNYKILKSSINKVSNK